MNRPSRTDDATDKHPDWNQNPPFLAPDLTTCQDMNGIANLRTHRAGSDGDGSLSGLPDEKNHLMWPAPKPDTPPVSSRWCSPGTHARSNCVSGGEGPSRLSMVTNSAAQSKCWSWLTWTFSVICCSVALSSLHGVYGLTALFGRLGKDDAITTSPPRRSPPLLKRSTCPNGGLNNEEAYNTPLHVGALLIILFVSFSACAFPLIAARFPRLRIPPSFFFAVRHFGTGVLLATAFVHLLPTAFILLGNPCLSGFWTNDYPAIPGAIALAGIFFVTIIEMVFQPARHMTHPGGPVAATPATGPTRAEMQRSDSDDGVDEDDGEPLPMGPLRGTSTSLGRQLSRLSRTDGEDQIGPSGRRDQAESGLEKGVSDLGSRVAGPRSHALSPAQQHQKDILQCMMLEVGILFHSVFIGMTLSVSIGQEFIILLIAIAFHQSFEGLALGARIAAIDWPEKSLQPWFMALAYGCTTPIGQAIGLATHSLYSPDSEFGLILVGTMNAISSGLLVFASLVELLSEDFLSDDSWRILRGKRRVAACLLVFFGAFGMSLVGAWA